MSDDAEPTEALSKAERLAIGGAVAPTLRKRAGGGRRITLVDKDGNPVGVTDDVTVARSLLARSEIEFSVQEGKRPAFVNCKTCGRPVKVPRKGPVPRVCLPGTHRCKCGKPVVKHSGSCGLGKECRVCSSRRSAAHGRAVAKATGAQAKRRKFSDAELREVIATGAHARAAARVLGVEESVVRARAIKLGLSLPDGRRACELPQRDHTVEVLDATKGNVTEAARAIGCSRMVLERHIDALDLRDWLTRHFPPSDRIRQGARRAGKARWGLACS